MTKVITTKDELHSKRQKQRKLKWAFFSYGHNYGETSRAIEIAKEMKKQGHDVRFFCHGGKYFHKIEEAGLNPTLLYPLITDEQDQQVMDIDQHRAPLGTPFPFSESELTSMVEEDIRVLREFSPDAAYHGLSLSTLMAIEYLKIPKISCVPSAVCPTFYKKGLAIFPNAMEKNIVTRYLLPKWLKNKLINQIMMGDAAKDTMVIFNKVRATYGLAPIYNLTKLVKGDITFLPDLPELSGLKKEELPTGYQFTGPLIARLDMPVPDQVKKVFKRPGVNIFCTMGSSGTPDILKKVVSILKNQHYFNVVCATTKILKPEELGPMTDRFVAMPMLPALEVGKLSDVIVSHGGQGTVQTAVMSGKPLVGIGMQWEQQANIEQLVRLGVGHRIALHSITQKSLIQGIHKVNTPPYIERAKALMHRVKEVDGLATVVDEMNRFVVSRSN